MQLSIVNMMHKRFVIIIAFMTLIGCTTKLAPSYDKNVVEQLSQLNVDTMVLMATISDGTSGDTFESRVENYNNLIGRLDALALSAGARPVPASNIYSSISESLKKRGIANIPFDETKPASVYPITKISETITMIRNTDKKQGITQYEADTFKNQVQIYFDQAITYENFLQR